MSAETKAEVERWLDVITPAWDAGQTREQSTMTACTRAIVAAIMHLADEVRQMSEELAIK